jgi:toluene monooxygenase electron transfer component
MADADAPQWNGKTGFIHEIARDFIGDRWNAYEYYFAGPPAMAQAVQQMLIEKRVPYPQVHFDSFY